MRKTLLAGTGVAITAALAVWIGDLFGLELDSVALLGVALGAVIALVPDGRPEWRLVGFVAGFAAAWVGYLLRAGVLPDSAGGRAVGYAVVVLVCVGAVAASMGRISLWSALVGVATLVGAFETAYVAAPSQVVDTSTVSATAVLLAAAFGFLAAALFVPQPGAARHTRDRAPRNNDPAGSEDRLDDLMVESAK